MGATEPRTARASTDAPRSCVGDNLSFGAIHLTRGVWKWASIRPSGQRVASIPLVSARCRKPPGRLRHRGMVLTGSRTNRHWTGLNSPTSAMNRNLSPTLTPSTLSGRWSSYLPTSRS